MAGNDLNAPQQAIRLLMGFILARAIYAAAKIGVADHIANSGSTAEELATRTAVNAPALERLLCTLSGYGVLRRDHGGRFFLTPMGETLRSNAPGSIRDYAIFVHEFLYDVFRELVGGVRTGESVVEKLFGASLFDHLQANPEKAALFHTGLANRGRIEAPAILETYSFAGRKRVVDLGGGNGAFLSAILAAHPDVSGVLLEQASAVKAARDGRGGPLPRCELIVGDYFHAVPPCGDIYVFKRVLFDHSDDEVIEIFQNCSTAMNPDGRLLIIEDLAGAANEPSLSHLMDLTFLLVTSGRARTEQVYRDLLEQAGFRLKQCLRTRADLSVLEAVRN